MASCNGQRDSDTDSDLTPRGSCLIYISANSYGPCYGEAVFYQRLV